MISPKKKVLFAFFLLMQTLLCGCTTPQEKIQRQSVFAMDTMFTITAVTEDDTLLDDCVSILKNLSDSLDHRKADSLLHTLHEDRTLNCPDDRLPNLLRQTAALQAQYGNAVQLTCKPLVDLWGIATETPYLPTENEILAAKAQIDDRQILVEGNTVMLQNNAALELGAVAKGYALDCIAARLRQSDTDYAVISASSAVLLYGQKPDAKPFSLQITNPDDGGILGTLIITHEDAQQITMLGTSGGYARYSEIQGKQYSHVLDLNTGAPTESDIASVTVVCENGLAADFLSTTAYLGGVDALQSHKDADWQYLVVGTDGKCYISPQLTFIKTAVES